MYKSIIDSLSVGLQKPTINLYLLIDVSSSMRGENIDSLNTAIRQTLKSLPLEMKKNNVDILLHALTYSSRVKWHIKDQSIADDVEWKYLSNPLGLTKMGEAIKSFTNDVIELKGKSQSLLPPVCLLFADGDSTDDFQSAIRYMNDSGVADDTIRVVVAIGDKVNLSNFNIFASPGRNILQAKELSDLNEIVKIICEQSIVSSSMSSTIGDFGNQEETKDEMIEALKDLF
ncbi:VWA domain-containing protein [Mycoplasmatota bacterium WC44]